jgi:hypothetical protein
MRQRAISARRVLSRHDSYIYGFALQEHSLPFELPARPQDSRAGHAGAVPR